MTRTQPQAPQALDAERYVLSAVLRDARLMDDAGALRADDFYLGAHSMIWSAAAALVSARRPVDAPALAAELHRSGRLDDAGGPAYIGDLIDFAGTTVGFRHHVADVLDASRKRRVLDAARRLAEAAMDPATSAEELAAQAQSEVMRSTDWGEDGDDAVPIKHCVREAIERAERRAKGESFGLPVVWPDLAAILGEWERGDLYVVGARPKMGKTSFAVDVAEHFGSAGTRVHVESLEMSRAQIGGRALSQESSLNGRSLMDGSLRDTEWPVAMASAGRLARYPITVCARPARTVADMARTCRRLRARQGLGALIVDYIQLVHPDPTDRRANREQQVSHIARDLKSLAGELNVPVIALSQLNRGVEQRPDKRPKVSDLRESGALEQHAAAIVLLYRDEVYNEQTQDKGIAEVIVGAHRHGPTGTARLRFVAESTTFRSLTRREDDWRSSYGMGGR